MTTRFILALFIIGCHLIGHAQIDSLNSNLGKLSPKYLHAVSSKADKYYDRVTSKTEKTLERLSKWENKIRRLLEKANPETARQLFGENQLTFSDMLERYREGKAAADGYKASYDNYRDKLSTSLKYLDQQKDSLNRNVAQPLTTAKAKMDRLNSQLNNTEVVQRLIKERRKQLLGQAVQYIGQSKYFKRINKDAYYAAESLRNYKKLFSEPGRAEATALNLLKKIPAFNEFLRKNSTLASIFRIGSAGDPASQANLSGLQTRASVNNFIQQQIANNPAARQQFSTNLQQAQSQLNELKNKIGKAGGGSGDEMPEGFRPNSQRSRTFAQRLEYSVNISSQKATNFFPVTSDVSLGISYKLSDRKLVSIGASYKVGLGRGWNHLRLSHEGIGFRSSAEFNLKKSFWFYTGYELNHRAAFNRIEELKDLNAFSHSGLAGLSKVINTKSRFFKKTKAQLLVDLLSFRQVPKTEPLLFRIGYHF